MEDPDIALFSSLNAAERLSLAPQRPKMLSELLATSSDPRMQALSGLSTDEANDVPFLLSLLSSHDAAVLEAAADALWKLAINGVARAALHKANGARPLVALLAHKEPRVVRASAGALSILALDSAQRTTIIAGGGAAALSAVLSDGGDREVEQAARAAANLAADGPTRTALLEQSAVNHISTLLRRRRSPPGLREAACRALGALAAVDERAGGAAAPVGSADVSERVADTFVDAAGTAALIDCLRPGATSTEAQAAARVGAADPAAILAAEQQDELLEGSAVTIAGVAARPELNGQQGTVTSFHSSSGRFHVKLDSGETVALRPACVQRLTPAQVAAAAADDANAPLPRAAVRAVRALAVHQRAADELIRLGVLSSLIELLGSRVPEIAAAAASAIGAIGTTEAHRAAISGTRAVAMLLRCLGEGSERSVQEPACAALRTLALHTAVREQLADSTALVPIVAVLSRGDAQAREAAAGLLGTVATLPGGRTAVLDAGAVQPLVKLLPLRHLPTQEAAARAIKNLAFAAEGSAQITKAGGTQPLVRLLKSGSEPLHSAASAALEVLTMEAAQREGLLGSLSW
jgi:hypothetical protein